MYYVRKQLLNLLRRTGIRRPRRRRRFVPSSLDDSNPMDMILLSYQLFSGDHQLVQVVHDAISCTDTDGEVP